MIQEDFDHYCRDFVDFFQEGQYHDDVKAFAYIGRLAPFAAALMKISIDEGLFFEENTSMIIKYLREVQAEAIEKELPAGPPIPKEPETDPVEIHAFMMELTKDLNLFYREFRELFY